MGRKKKPIEQHKREGTYKPYVHNGPEIEAQRPDKPEDLTGTASEAWDELAPVLEDMGVLTIADGLALRLLCDSYGFYMDACDTIETEGKYLTLINKGGGEYVTEHPAVKARARCWKEVETMARQFGLTPSARTGLSVVKVEDKKPSALEAILRGGRN